MVRSAEKANQQEKYGSRRKTRSQKQQKQPSENQVLLIGNRKQTWQLNRWDLLPRARGEIRFLRNCIHATFAERAQPSRVRSAEAKFASRAIIV